MQQANVFIKQKPVRITNGTAGHYIIPLVASLIVKLFLKIILLNK